MYRLIIFLFVFLIAFDFQSISQTYYDCFDREVNKIITTDKNIVVLSNRVCGEREFGKNVIKGNRILKISCFDNLLKKTWEVEIDSARSMYFQNTFIVKKILFVIIQYSQEIDYKGEIGNKRENKYGKIYSLNLDNGNVIEKTLINENIVASQITDDKLFVFTNSIIRKNYGFDDANNTIGKLLQFNYNLLLIKEQPFLNKFRYSYNGLNSIFNYMEKNKFSLFSFRIYDSILMGNKVSYTIEGPNKYLYCIQYFRYDKSKMEITSDSIYSINDSYNYWPYAHNFDKNRVDFIYKEKNNRQSLLKYGFLNYKKRKFYHTDITCDELLLTKNKKIIYNKHDGLLNIYNNKLKLKNTYDLVSIIRNTTNSELYYQKGKDLKWFEFKKHIYTIHVKNKDLFFINIMRVR